MEEKEDRNESTACEPIEEAGRALENAESTASATDAQSAPPGDDGPARAGKPHLKKRARRFLGATVCILGVGMLFAANLFAERYMIGEEFAEHQLEIFHNNLVKTPVMVDDETFARLTHVKLGDEEFDLPRKARDFVSEETGKWHVRDADVDMFIYRSSDEYAKFLLYDGDEDIRLTITLLNQVNELRGWTTCDVTSVKLEAAEDADFPMEVAGIRIGQQSGLAGGLGLYYDDFVRHGNEPYDVTYSFSRESDGRIAKITVTYDRDHVVRGINAALETDGGLYRISRYAKGSVSSDEE